jgi:hypothetical protein
MKAFRCSEESETNNVAITRLGDHDYRATIIASSFTGTADERPEPGATSFADSTTTRSLHRMASPTR